MGGDAEGRDSGAALLIGVRARNLGSLHAEATTGEPLKFVAGTCPFEVHLYPDTAPTTPVWRHGDLAAPCPGMGYNPTLVAGGDWVKLMSTEVRVPVRELLQAGLPSGAYLLSVSLILGINTGQDVPPGPERRRWREAEGLRCRFQCTVTVPAGVLRIRQ
jgi:hypothetical protein